MVKAIKTNDPSGAFVRETIARVVQEFSSSRRSDVKIIVDVDPQGTM